MVPPLRGGGQRTRESEKFKAIAFSFNSPSTHYFRNKDYVVRYNNLFCTGNKKKKKKLQPMLKKALNDSDIQTELTPVIMNRILSGVQLWSQDQVTGLMGKTTELDS